MRTLFGIFFLTAWSAIISPFANAQNFHDAMVALHNKYQGQDNLSILMNVQAFETSSSARPFYETQVSVKKTDRSYKYIIGSNEMLMNDKYIVMLDHSMKEMVWGLRDPSQERAFQTKIKFNMDSILNFYDEGSYVGFENNTDHYSAVQKKGDVSKVDLFIDHESGLLTKMTYLYKTSQFVSISFLKFDANPAFDKSTFDEGYYFQKSGNELTPSARFIKYKLINASDRKNQGRSAPSKKNDKSLKN